MCRVISCGVKLSEFRERWRKVFVGFAAVFFGSVEREWVKRSISMTLSHRYAVD